KELNPVNPKIAGAMKSIFGPQAGTARPFKRGGKPDLWRVDIHINGKRFVEYAKTEKEANDKLNRLRNVRSLTALPVPKLITVGEFLEDWLTRVSPSWAYSTAKKNREIV